MTFQHIAAPGSRPSAGLGTKRAGQIDLKSIYRTLALIAPAFGLATGALTTLRAMIACVRPEKGMICFASTATLLRLRSGGSDRTIRRHAEQLADAGVLARNDSPNGKRYAMLDSSSGESVAFGFDLTPMVNRAADWSVMAEEMAAEESRRKYLRTVILGRLHRLDQLESGVDTSEFRKILRRRKLSLLVLEGHLSTVVDLLAAYEPSDPPAPPPATPANTACDPSTENTVAFGVTSVAAAGGQNGRHYSRSETKYPDSEDASPIAEQPIDPAALLRMAESCCTEAMSFAEGALETWSDVARLAAMIGPMIGIDKNLIRDASDLNGNSSASLTVLLVLQMGGRIRNHGAYYRSITLGSRRAEYNPWKQLGKLFRSLA